MLEGIPLGHAIAAHLLLGWCSHCPGRDAGQEALSWRVWAGNHVPEVEQAIRRQFGETTS